MNLPEEKQTLASEIISDQQKEIEGLKLKLQNGRTQRFVLYPKICCYDAA